MDLPLGTASGPQYTSRVWTEEPYIICTTVLGIAQTCCFIIQHVLDYKTIWAYTGYI